MPKKSKVNSPVVKEMAPKPEVKSEVVAPVPQVKSEADMIWQQVKNLPIEMFGLPEQFVHMHVNQVMVEPSKLYLTLRSSAVLPALETAVAPAFQVEMADKFVIVRRVPPALVAQKRK